MKTNLASRNLERRIMTASHVLCFNCVWIALNLRWMIETIRSISLDEMGRVRDPQQVDHMAGEFIASLIGMKAKSSGVNVTKRAKDKNSNTPQ